MFDMKLPPWFQRTAVGKKIVAEAVTDATRARQKILDEIGAKERQLAEVDARLKPLVDSTHEELLAADKVLTAAKSAHRAAYSEWGSATNAIEHQIATLRWRLRRTSDEATIDAFIREIEGLRERARRIPIGRTYGHAGAFSVRQIVTGTNRRRVVRALEALDKARQSAEALYEVVDIDVADRIAAIRATFPDLVEAALEPEPVPEPAA
jgi:hypothetical protein